MSGDGLTAFLAGDRSAHMVHQQISLLQEAQVVACAIRAATAYASAYSAM